MTDVVLDTNIYLSGFLFGGNARKIIENAIEGKIRIHISNEILFEIATVLKRPKFGLNERQTRLIINEIEFLCNICEPSESIQDVCRDVKDHIILECAVESRSEYIITGDVDLLTLKDFREIKIINCNDFLTIIECQK